MQPLGKKTGAIAFLIGILMTLARPEVSDALRVVLGAWGPKAPQIAGIVVSAIAFVAHVVVWLSHPPTAPTQSQKAAP